MGGQDVATGPVAVTGTYYGTLSGSNRNSYTNTLTATVLVAGTVYTCKVVNAGGGTDLVRIPVIGFDPTAPHFSVAAQDGRVKADASSWPDTAVAPGQSVDFVTYGFDLMPGSIIYR